MTYIHEKPDWPNLRWDDSKLSTLLADIRYRQGMLLGRLSAFGFDLRQEAELRTLTSEVVKTSSIEGETEAVLGRSQRAPGVLQNPGQCKSSPGTAGESGSISKRHQPIG